MDSATAIAPDEASYREWLGVVQPEYDFMEPTKVAPEPRAPETAASAANPPSPLENAAAVDPRQTTELPPLLRTAHARD